MPLHLAIFILTIFFASHGMAADFPTGKLAGIGFLVEKGSMKITEKELHHYSSSATIEKQFDNSYIFTIDAILQSSPSTPRKNEKRVDTFDVIWETSSSGKLVNMNPSYKDDESSFKIENEILTIKSWIARNQLWETHFYSMRK